MKKYENKKKEQEVQQMESKLRKFGLKNKLSPESIDTWVSYYSEHSDLSKAMMKSKMRDEKKIKELCLERKLVPEKSQEWVLFYQKYSSFIPIGFIEEQIQQGKDISLQTVVEENEERSNSIAEFALGLGYSIEESEMWGKICTKIPHIRRDVIEHYIKAEKKYTQDEFKLIICKYEIANAILHSLDKYSESKSYDRCNIHKVNLQQQDEQMDVFGDTDNSFSLEPLALVGQGIE